MVHAVTDKVCEFYYEANERFFAAAGDLMDGFFFGNDLGSQAGLVCGPACLEEFVFPWMRRFVDQGHRHGYQVALHSCGAVRVIGVSIAAVELLPPIQALAEDADCCATLPFNRRRPVMGGIDTQKLLTHGTPEQFRADVRRVRSLLGPNLIISPSHEAILPNVPPENVEALVQECTGQPCVRKDALMP